MSGAVEMRLLLPQTGTLPTLLLPAMLLRLLLQKTTPTVLLARILPILQMSATLCRLLQRRYAL